MKEINITIAREASNFQRKKVITTGVAFWIESTTTTAMTITMSSGIIQFSVYIRRLTHADSFKYTNSAEDVNISMPGIPYNNSMTGQQASFSH
jgi:hypothetical protein